MYNVNFHIIVGSVSLFLENRSRPVEKYAGRYQVYRAIPKNADPEFFECLLTDRRR